jgi:L-amino acid N-acyltransferase YncA
MMVEYFLIRPAIPQDWEQIVSIYNYYILNTVFNFEYEIYTLQSRSSWLQQFQDSQLYRLLVGVNEDNSVIGYAATTPFSAIAGYHTSVNISVYCHSKFIHIGLGSALVKELIEQCRLSKIHRIYAGITIPNNPSMKLFRKFNFSQIAHFKEVGHKFKQYWDVVWFEKTLS